MESSNEMHYVAMDVTQSRCIFIEVLAICLLLNFASSAVIIDKAGELCTELSIVNGCCAVSPLLDVDFVQELYLLCVLPVLG